MNSDAKADLIAWFDAHSTLPGETDDDVLLELPNGAVSAAAEAVTMGKMLVELSHRWHVKKSTWSQTAISHRRWIEYRRRVHVWWDRPKDYEPRSGTERPAWPARHRHPHRRPSRS